MKKFITVLGIMAICLVVSSCSNNVEEETFQTMNQWDKWIKQCIKEHAEKASDLFKTLALSSNRNKELEATSVKCLMVGFECDVVEIYQKTFEPLFEKYGEEKVLRTIHKIADTYHDNFYKTEEQFRKGICAQALDFYTEATQKKAEEMVSEYKMKRLRGYSHAEALK